MSEIFKYPINYTYGRASYSVDASLVRTAADVIDDNDYRTSSSLQRFILETHGATRTTNSRITHIYVKAEGLTNYSVSIPTGRGTGTGLTNHVIPASGVVNGVQHDLQSLGPLETTEVQIDLVGASTRLIEVMLLESVFTLENAYTAVNPVKEDRGGGIRRNSNGNTFKVQGLEGRYKWSTAFTALFLPNASPGSDDVLRVFEENTNFTFAEDFTRWPDRVYPATINGGVAISYLGRTFSQRQLEFNVMEI